MTVLDLTTGGELATFATHRTFAFRHKQVVGPDNRTLAAHLSEGGRHSVLLWDVAANREVIRLEAGGAPVSCSAFSPDGALFAFGTEAGTVFLCDTKTAEHRARSGVEGGGIAQLAFSPAASHLASRSKGGTVRLWNLGTDRVCATIPRRSAEIVRSSFNPDGSHLLSVYEDGAVKLWNLETGREERSFESGLPRLEWGEFSPGGETLIVRAPPGPGTGVNTTGYRLEIWDVATARRRAALGPLADCWLRFCANGQMFLGQRDSCHVGLYRVAGGEVRRFGVPSTRVWQYAFCSDESLLATGHEDGTIRLWQLQTGRQLALLRAHEERSVSRLLFARDGTTLVSTGRRGVKVWDVTMGRDLGRLRPPSGAPWRLYPGPGGNSLVSHSDACTLWDLAARREVGMIPFGPTVYGSAERDGSKAGLFAFPLRDSISLWDVRSGRRIATLPVGKNHVFSSDGATLASYGYEDGTIWLWNARTGQERSTLGPHPGPVSSACFSPDGTVLASVAVGTVTLWDAVSGHELAVIPGRENGISAFSFSPDGATLAARVGSAIELWSVPAKRKVAELVGHQRGWGLRFSPDGRTLASWVRDGQAPEATVFLWDTATGRARARLPGVRVKVREYDLHWWLAFAPDSTLLALPHPRGTQIWNVLQGKRIGVLRDPAPAWALAFSPDSRTLACRTERAMVLWDVATGVRLASGEDPYVLRHEDPRMRPCFSADGDTVAWVRSDGHVQVWDTSEVRTPTLAEARSVTGCRLEAFEVRRATTDGASRSADRELVRRGLTWGPHSPYRWLPGAQKGDAQGLYRLAVLREQQLRDREARRLHERATSTTGPGQNEWAAKSRERLEQMPWFQPWFAAYQSGKDLLAGGKVDEAIRTVRKSTVLTAEQQTHVARLLALRMTRAGDTHYSYGKLVEAEREWTVAMQLDVSVLDEFVPGWRGALVVLRTMPALTTGTYEDWVEAYKSAATELRAGDPERLGREVLAALTKADKTLLVASEYVRSGLAGPRSGLGVELAALASGLTRAAEQAIRPSLPTKAVDLERGIRALDLALEFAAHAKWHPDSLVRPLLFLAQKQFELGQKGRAIARCFQATGITPDADDVRRRLRELLGKLDRDQDAEGAYRKAIELYETFLRDHPRDPGDRTEVARTLGDLGELLERLRQNHGAEVALRRAVELYEALVRDHPEVPDYREALASAHGRLAGLLHELGRDEDAGKAYRGTIELYEALVRDHPDTPAYCSKLAWLLATCADESLRRPLEAVQLARKAVESSPKAGSYWTTLGVAHCRAGGWQDAVAALRRSTELGRGRGSSGFFLAMSHWQLENKDEARQWYEKAVAWMEKAEPDDEELKRFRSEAEELLGIAPE